MKKQRLVVYAWLLLTLPGSGAAAQGSVTQDVPAQKLQYQCPPEQDAAARRPGLPVSAAASALERIARWYHQQEYEQALALLDTIGESGEAGMRADYYRALILHQLFDYDRAAPLLHQMLQRCPDDVLLLRAAVPVAIAQGQWQQARAYNRRLRDTGQQQLADFYTARLAEAQNDNDAALAAYQRSLQGVDERLRRRSARALVDLYQRLGQPSQAYAVAQQAQAMRHNRFDSHHYSQLAEPDDDAPPRHAQPLRAVLGYRLEYDDNVTLADEDSVLLPAVEDSGLRHTLTADVLYQHALGRALDVFAEAHVSQSFHQEGDQDEFNVTRLNAVLGAGGRWGDFGWRVPVEYTHQRFGGDFFSEHFSLLPGVYYQPGEQWLFHAFTRLSDNNFERALRVSDDRDGHSWRVGLLVNSKPWYNVQWRTIVESGEDDTDGANNQRDELRAYTYLQYDFHPDWTVGLGFQYRERDYDNLHDLFLIRRDDELTEAYLSLAWRLDTHWRLRAQATHQDQDSNIGVFAYERNVFSLGLSWEY